MEQLISIRIKKAITDRVFPGCVIGWVKNSGEKKIMPFGSFTYESSAQLVKGNSIFDTASITKSIPGSASILALIDQKKLNLEDRLADIVPEFGNFENKKEVTIKHLLTYTLDLVVPAMSSLKDKAADQIINFIIKAPLRNPPGSKFLYTNSTAFFTGMIVKKITGKNLDEFSDNYFFKPLEMQNTSFHPEKFHKQEIVPTEINEWRGGLLQGIVHDESTFILNKKYISGIAGLFSTVPDLLNFEEMLLNRGIQNGVRFFSGRIVTQMHTNQLEKIGAFAGLGWEMNDSMRMGKFSKEIIGKTGFTGCIVMINFTKGAALAILSNRVHPKRPSDGGKAINEVRRDIADIIFSE